MLKIIDLPYPMNALEPYYSTETLNLHYNILYKGYVDNTNKTEEKLNHARESNDFSNIKCLEKRFKFFWFRSDITRIIFLKYGTIYSDRAKHKISGANNKRLWKF